MTMETFFEKFDQLADTPNAVAKMRELVLELAVQGKLIDQDPTEGDGYALLDLIRKKNSPSNVDHEVGAVDVVLPNLPSSWAASRLGEVAEIVRGVSFPGSAKSETCSNGDVACLRTASVQAEIDWDDLIFISPTHVSRSDQWVAPNDIIISMANSYALVGKVAIVRHVPQKATFGAFLAAIRPILIEPYFLLYVLRSPRMQAAFRDSSSQTTNIANISLGRMRPLPFPLPPLAEQKRIVAKVDELMTLCDRLEAQQQERETWHASLARASLARFADAPTLANLDFLFHKSYDVDPADLRKSILALAVQGKLVPQNPNDGDARDFIDCAMEKRQQTIQSKNLRRKHLNGADKPICEEELPSSWCVERLANLVDPQNTISYGVLVPGSDVAQGIPFVRVQDLSLNNPAALPNKTIAPEIEKPYARTRLRGGEILLCVVGATIGRLGIAPHSWAGANIARAVARISPIAAVYRDYLLLVLRGPPVQSYFATTTRTLAQPTLNVGAIEQTPIPVPPLAEQRRIVAKVDQLMALVDQLETQLAASRDTAEKLMEAVVAELTAKV